MMRYPFIAAEKAEADISYIPTDEGRPGKAIVTTTRLWKPFSNP